MTRSLNSSARTWVLNGTLATATALTSITAALPALAMDSTEVLPESVNSPSLRMGVVSGIGMRFLSSGDLMSLSDVNSIQFNAKDLAQLDPRVNQLISVLNQFGSGRLGDQLSLGVLRVETTPEVRYLAPVYARGITSQWTVGVGLPILTYRNKIELKQYGSNVAAIQATIGTGSTELTDGLQQFNVNLAATAQDVLISKGYRPLTDRNESLIGDLQLVSLLQFAKSETSNSSFQLRSIFSVPTGRGDDPDDLADLGAYGFTAIENQLTANYIFRGRWRLAAKGGHRYTFQDDVVRRVPLNEADTLPDSSRKEDVSRSTGSAFFAGASLTYSATEALDLSLGLEATRKSGDSYTGSKASRYDLLSRNTESSADRVRLGLTYSSVEKFMEGKALLPAMLAYEFSDTFRGINAERATVHEIWLQLFF